MFLHLWSKLNEAPRAYARGIFKYFGERNPPKHYPPSHKATEGYPHSSTGLHLWSFTKADKNLLFISFLYILIIYQYINYVPLWDAWDNTAHWITDAVTQPFNLFNFESFGHPSIVYFFLLGLPWYFDLGNQYLMHTVNIILFILSIFSFYSIVKFLFSEDKQEVERLLSTILYAFFPIFLGNSIHINPDFGQLVFYVIFLGFILNKRYLSAAIAAIGLIFSKEPGIVMYIFTIILYFIYTYILNKNHLTTDTRNIKGKTYLLIPLALFVLYILIKLLVLKQQPFWLGAINILKASQMTHWPSWNQARIPISYFLATLVINFNWILSTFIFLGFVNSYLQIFKKIKDSQERITFYKSAFIYVLFIGMVLFLTFFKTFTNLRYFLPIYFVMIVSFVQSISTLINSKIIRRLILTIVTILFFLNNFRTFDPLSKKIYGTFKFGSHEMLKMTSITGECCGYGRDQLVYNLEFAQIHFLLNKIFKDLRPTENISLAYQPLLGPYVINRLDRITYQRSLKKNTLEFSPNTNIVNWRFDFLPQKPETLYYLVFPNADNKLMIDYYKKYYTVSDIKSYTIDGYMMEVYTLVLDKSKV